MRTTAVFEGVVGAGEAVAVSRRRPGEAKGVEPLGGEAILRYLILLDQTELLPRFYGQVIVPEAVLGSWGSLAISRRRRGGSSPGIGRVLPGQRVDGEDV